eukprot:6112735-Amphidinium_carterae.1
MSAMLAQTVFGSLWLKVFTSATHLFSRPSGSTAPNHFKTRGQIRPVRIPKCLMLLWRSWNR